MKRLGNISQAVETLQNFREAFFDFSRHKKSRLSVQAFEAEFERNLQALLNAYVNQTWHTSDYEVKQVEKPKHRIVNKLPVGDHVIQHAAMHTSEDKLRAKIPFNSPAGTKGRGTHFFIRLSSRISLPRHSKTHSIACPWIYIIISKMLSIICSRESTGCISRTASCLLSSTRSLTAMPMALCWASSLHNFWGNCFWRGLTISPCGVSTYSKTPRNTATGRLGTSQTCSSHAARSSKLSF